MRDSAKGPSSGYIYQFEIGLLELAKLNKGEAVSIEHVDDVAVIDNKGTYMFTIQAKHSITASSSNFGNTSEDLWKTLNLWIAKLESGMLKKENKFIAITNNTIPENAIIRKFSNKRFSEILIMINSIKDEQERKLNEKIKKKQENKTKNIEKDSKGENVGSSHKKIISRIKEVLSKETYLQSIVENFEFREKVSVKELFLNKIFISAAEVNVQDNIYHTFLGWIQDKSKEYWLDKKQAIFSKEDFDVKYNSIRDNHSLVNAIFRGKKSIESMEPIDLNFISRDELYVRQIEDIDRYEKEEIINKAILDFIYKDVEMLYQIKNNPMLTKSDFKDFEDKCEEHWRSIKRKHIRKHIERYTLDELNDLAIDIYDEIMNDLKLYFQDSWGFDDSNKYIQNGTFLSLTNDLKIGWHPDWEKRYKS
ncbi:ABC-three component system protein [Myroides odoratimimus]|uniref:ABC-three component system protein n=1 Tax=Myroides odoratimimus TaxID=76832 RepID=UPI00257753AB|nr:ABC-three component system protein [Myroides odoratimimus]MDM1093723.1 hypothetical protein [Myroides odoratimimus]